LRVVIACLAAAAMAPACGGDACVAGESECDGDAIRSCGSPGDITGARDFTGLARGCGDERCLDIVRAGKRDAVCSATGQPDPRCPSDGYTTVCAGPQTLLRCERGYGSHEEHCEGVCVPDVQPAGAATRSALCALEPTPHPTLCTQGTVCDGTAVVACVLDYVVKRTPCPAEAPLCVLGHPRTAIAVAHCARTETCASPDGATCNGNTVRGCIAGHVVATDCGGEKCEAYGVAPEGDAACEVPCRRVRDYVCVDP
jgi:hypothetical protein